MGWRIQSYQQVNMSDPSHFKLPPHLNVTPFDRINLPSDCFVASGVQLIGNLHIAVGVSFWFNSVLRGDVNYIEIGAHSNIQDNSTIHVTNHNPCVVANEVTVGHNVNLHGCSIAEKCLIGIGAVVLTGAQIGTGSVIAAGAVIRENEIVPPFSLMAGVPAKRIKNLSETILDQHAGWAHKYFMLAQKYLSR